MAAMWLSSPKLPLARASAPRWGDLVQSVSLRLLSAALARQCVGKTLLLGAENGEFLSRLEPGSLGLEYSMREVDDAHANKRNVRFIDPDNMNTELNEVPENYFHTALIRVLPLGDDPVSALRDAAKLLARKGIQRLIYLPPSELDTQFLAGNEELFFPGWKHTSKSLFPLSSRHLSRVLIAERHPLRATPTQS